ncbi:tetratricopeptide repeat-containing diguanylate cyclase [Alteromonas sp. C1M14]|uniref:tetratricopeptide repeat-containing diguanylate cyclase n=1 Tax=Alteromonas sp. C1M14 TaxID=2841567 RepID=UPI001C0A61E1|nr:tetratricopeptide repeat-containing diguanylate cyclase [Alteromonas sp. C1M14]MBU2979586.1 GGDEF domain-containing protein [Alteromonas sp. C1M14]
MRTVNLFGFILLMQLPFVYAQDAERIESLKTAIVAAREAGKLQQTEQLTEELAVIATNRADPMVTADLQVVRAQNDISRNQYQEAIDKLYAAIPTLKAQHQHSRLANAYTYVGYSYYNLSEYKQALDYYYQAKTLFDLYSDTKGQSMVNSYTGLVLSAIGDYKGAILAYKTALETAIEAGYENETSQAFYSLGGLNAKLGNHRQALEYFSSSLEIDEKQGVVQNIAFNNGLIAESLYHLDELERAKSHATTAIRLFEQTQSVEYACMYKLTLAKVYIASSEYEKAQGIIDQVYKDADGHYPALALNTLLVAADLALKVEDYDRAVSLAETGIQQAQNAERMPVEEQFFQIKVAALEHSNRYEKGYRALQTLMEINGKLNDESKLKAISVAQAQTEAIRSKLELELQTKERALQEAELNRQLLLRNVFIVLILLLSILVFFLFRRQLLRKNNQYLSEQVRVQTRELNEKNDQLVQALKLVESDSITDALTGLKNRRYLEKFIDTDILLVDREYADWREGKSPKPLRSDLIVFVLDIDDFKAVNDTYGHHIGDEILAEFAERITQVFRQSDYVVRWGGEEFVAVARFVDRKRASRLAGRIKQALNEAHFAVHEGKLISVTASIGYACYPSMINSEEKGNWETLFAMADACLYLAKEAGKNTWVGLESVNDNRCLNDEFNKKTLSQFIQQNWVTVKRANRAGD